MDAELPAQTRLDFLFKNHWYEGHPRYRLISPDILELRWTVWDAKESRTVSYGNSAGTAIDGAAQQIEHARLLAEADELRRQLDALNQRGTAAVAA